MDQIILFIDADECFLKIRILKIYVGRGLLSHCIKQYLVHTKILCKLIIIMISKRFNFKMTDLKKSPLCTAEKKKVKHISYTLIVGDTSTILPGFMSIYFFFFQLPPKISLRSHLHDKRCNNF